MSLLIDLVSQIGVEIYYCVLYDSTLLSIFEFIIIMDSG
jgi:hypothetical protein